MSNRNRSQVIVIVIIAVRFNVIVIDYIWKVIVISDYFSWLQQGVQWQFTNPKYVLIKTYHINGLYLYKLLDTNCTSTHYTLDTICVAIVHMGLYTSDSGWGRGLIIYCARNSSQTVVRGLLDCLVSRHGRLPLWLVAASCGDAGSRGCLACVLEEDGCI